LPPDPEPLVQVAAIVLGAGASGAITGAVQKFAPQMAIAPDILGAGVGAVLYYFGDRIHPLVKAFGVGVLAGSLKGTIEKAIPAIAPTTATSTTTSSSGGSSSNAAVALAMAQAYANQQKVKR